MAKAPAFQFYVQDFLLGVRHFTAEEVGAYVLLLCEQWDNGFIENDAKNLKKIAKISPKKLEKVIKKFEKTDIGLVNKRLETERQKQAEYREKQRNNALKKHTKPPANAQPTHDSGTSQKHALQSSSSSSTSNKLSDDNLSVGIAFLPLEDLKATVLSDKKFFEPLFRAGILPDKVPGWLDAFHRFLQYTGATMKQESDYRRHFGNWVTKIPGYTTMNPDEYTPVTAGQQEQRNDSGLSAAALETKKRLDAINNGRKL